MELQDRLDNLTANRENYKFTDTQSIRNKKVVAILGPSAVGKSTIIHRALELAAEQGVDAAEAGTSATRAAREDDPPNYHTGIPVQDMVNMIEQGKPVNWSVFTTGQIYATLPQDFPAEYNFMACLPDSLPMLRRAGFAAVHAFYIVTDTESWQEQLKPRRFMPDGKTYRPDFGRRMDEALLSLQFGRNSNKIKRVINKFGKGDITKVAQQILDTSGQPTNAYGVMEPDDAETIAIADSYINEMYNVAIDMAQDFENNYKPAEK
jgi:GTPase SAR1 family protein